MKPKHFVLKPEQRDPALSVLGTQVTVLAANAVTQSYGITLQQGDAGTGPPPHCHDWDEAFFVLGGSVEFTCAGETVLCLPGTLVHLPRGTMHGFRYGAGGGQMLEITGEGAQAAQMFTAIDHEIPPGSTDLPRIVQVFGRHGVRFQA